MGNKYTAFNIIKHAGDPVEGTLPDGRKVHKLKEITEMETSFDGKRKRVTYLCADYGNHFIYKVPRDVIGPKYCCTCGSMAVLTGSRAYEKQASAQGRLWVCKQHTDTGRHVGGGM